VLDLVGAAVLWTLVRERETHAAPAPSMLTSA